MTFDPNKAREAAKSMASESGRHFTEDMNSHWDAQGAFVAGARWQHTMQIAEKVMETHAETFLRLRINELEDRIKELENVSHNR